MLCCDQLMIVNYAVKGTIDTIVQIVHDSVQFSRCISNLPLGVDLTDEGICSSHKESTRFSYNLNTFIAKMSFHRLIHNASYLGWDVLNIFNILIHSFYLPFRTAHHRCRENLHRYLTVSDHSPKVHQIWRCSLPFWSHDRRPRIHCNRSRHGNWCQSPEDKD